MEAGDLSRFVEWLLARVILVGIRAPSRDSGFRIFESMNDRGTRLTPVEASAAVSRKEGAGKRRSPGAGGSLRLGDVPVCPETGAYVELGVRLGPRSWWYITETVIYHQSKLTRQGPPGSASHKRIAAPPPDRMTSPST